MKYSNYLYGVFLMLFIGMFFVSCDFMDDYIKKPIKTICDKKTIFDGDRYQLVSTANYQVDNVVLNEDCLEVTITSSACLPEHLEMNLIATGSSAAVYPPLVTAKIELKIHSSCTVIQQKTVSFDVTPLQMSGTDKIQISIDGWNTPIIYQY